MLKNQLWHSTKTLFFSKDVAPELRTQSFDGECCFRCQAREEQPWYRCDTFDYQADYCNSSFSGQIDHLCTGIWNIYRYLVFFILIPWKLSFYFLLLSVDCEYGEYPDAITEPYCSKRCGGGTMVLVNQNITQPSQGGGQECPETTKTVPCNQQQCPTNCKIYLDCIRIPSFIHDKNVSHFVKISI